MKKYFLQRRNSIVNAWKGLVGFFGSEAHATIHLCSATLVVIMGWMFSVSRMEWIGLIVAIGMVILAEIFNTVFEKVADYVQPNFDPKIKLIKDIAAGGVLWCSIIAIFMGSIIFIPYITSWLKI